jgi:PAP2 superfamily
MKRRMSRAAWSISFVVLAVSVVGLGEPVAGNGGPRTDGPPDTYVAAWDAVGVQAFSAAGLSPAEGHPIFAYVAIAVYDAVMAAEGGYEPFAVDIDAPDGASSEAAVAAAARRILVHYLPGQAASIVEPAYESSLATIPDGQAEMDGVETGDAVATRLIELRAGDGFRAPVTYTPPNPPTPGVWLPTASTPAVGTYLGLMDPFSLRAADQFRPSGPPRLDSRRWARDYNEVKEIGSSTSTNRTPEQTLAARFWNEPPVQQARGSFQRFVRDHELDIVDAARFMAMISVTYADALIACFDAKYVYTFWRPITAIHAGDTDGNARTTADPAWATLLPGTPNHPDYPSGHSCITPAGGRVIARFLGTRAIDLTVPSLTGLGDRHYPHVRDLEYEVSNARIWGGIHFRSAVNDGVKLGTRVSSWVLAHHFHRSHD